MSRAGLLMALWRRSRRHDTVVLDGAAGYVDRVAAALLRRFRPHLRIIMTDSTWSPGATPVAGFLRLAATRLMDAPRTHYVVLSTDELHSFPGTWRVDKRRVHVSPFYWTLPDHSPEIVPGAGVFAGGNAQRDYPTLLSAIRPLTFATVTVAANWRPESEPVPAHVDLRTVSPERFRELLRSSSVVVTPMVGGSIRSAGQQTFLSAMSLDKITVTSDVPGVRDHVDDGVNGIVVPPGDPQLLRDAITWALDPRNAAAVETCVLAPWSPPDASAPTPTSGTCSTWSTARKNQPDAVKASAASADGPCREPASPARRRQIAAAPAERDRGAQAG